MPFTPTEAAAHVRSVGLDPDRMPRHIAVIMDGNGRWAVERGDPRFTGHVRGTQIVRDIVDECCHLGLGQLTLYCFSVENWKRPAAEVAMLMGLLKEYLLAERDRILRENIRFTVIGRREGISDDVQAEMDTNIRLSRDNTGLTLCLAINYGSRTEIVDAMRSVARQVQAGTLAADTIDEATVSNALYTAGMPDPDLLIRTAGEMRVSNYLLWQISYAELWVTQKCWPDFDAATLHEALKDFANRERRFGGLQPVKGAV
ncbi:isoprenyl transferase [Limnoglobus roseus]|uniref:Isoprenyl transferase n=1 Tax=Limnoglobus roseus TaxID=2598579 RepID=A0A5C1AJR7_9BACT|nr:isoprenyl transferase [Limnoglobus roseus]QEL18443.1 isoprenyl transferase [Limnoglobus roseus]